MLYTPSAIRTFHLNITAKANQDHPQESQHSVCICNWILVSILFLSLSLPRSFSNLLLRYTRSLFNLVSTARFQFCALIIVHIDNIVDDDDDDDGGNDYNNVI